MVKTMVMQVMPLQPKGDHSGADIHAAAHGGPHARGGCVLKEAAAHAESILEQAPGRTFKLMERSPCWEQAFWQELWLCGGPTLEQSIGVQWVSGGWGQTLFSGAQ